MSFVDPPVTSSPTTFVELLAACSENPVSFDVADVPGLDLAVTSRWTMTARADVDVERLLRRRAGWTA